MTQTMPNIVFLLTKNKGGAHFSIFIVKHIGILISLYIHTSIHAHTHKPTHTPIHTQCDDIFSSWYTSKTCKRCILKDFIICFIC